MEGLGGFCGGGGGGRKIERSRCDTASSANVRNNFTGIRSQGEIAHKSAFKVETI